MPIASAVLEALQLAAQALPALEQLVPVIGKLINGETATEADAATVYATTQALEAQVAANAAKVEGADTTGGAIIP